MKDKKDLEALRDSVRDARWSELEISLLLIDTFPHVPYMQLFPLIEALQEKEDEVSCG